MTKWLLLFIGAPTVGMLLFWWASAYDVEWVSKQMLWLWAIMFLDRQLFHAWRVTSKGN